MQLLCGLVVVGKVAVKNINNAFESFFGKEFHSPTLDVWLDFVLVNQSAEQIRIVFVPSAKLRHTHIAFGFYHFSHSFQSLDFPQSQDSGKAKLIVTYQSSGSSPSLVLSDAPEPDMRMSKIVTSQF